MISRFVALLFLFWITYILWVFFLPETFDTYGNISLNAKIRDIKNMSLSFASWSEDPVSLFEKVKDTWKSYIKETQDTYTHIEKTLSGKVQEVQKAVDSVDRALDAVNQAKSDINTVIWSSTWTVTP